MYLGKVITTVALLHDVVEDTSVILEEIHQQFGKTVGTAVEMMTRRKGDSYFNDYIPALMTNPVSRIVKLADAKDNLNREATTDAHRSLKDRYRKAIEILED